jgi:hypothetical protein
MNIHWLEVVVLCALPARAGKELIHAYPRGLLFGGCYPGQEARWGIPAQE